MPAPRSALFRSSILATRLFFPLFSLVVFGGKSVSIVYPVVDVGGGTRFVVVEESITLFRIGKVTNPDRSK